MSFFPEPELLFDVEAGVNLTDSLSVLLGAQNVLNEYPGLNPNGEVAGLIYPEQSPFGFNGGYYYLRATWQMP